LFASLEIICKDKLDELLAPYKIYKIFVENAKILTSGKEHSYGLKKAKFFYLGSALD